MDEYYGHHYGQNERQGSMQDETMVGMNISQASDKDFFGQETSGHASTGMQNQPPVPGQTESNLSSQDPGNGRADNLQGTTQMSGLVPGAHFNNLPFGGGMGQNFMVPNAMLPGQQQANMNLMAQMMNTNRMYANMMSNNAASSTPNTTSPVQQSNGQGTMMPQMPMAPNARDTDMLAMMQNGMGSFNMMSGAQMMPSMMINPVLQQNLQRSMQMQNGSQNSKTPGSQASEMSNGNTGGTSGIRKNSSDPSLVQGGQMQNNSYGPASRRNSTPQSRHASIPQPPRRSSTAAITSVRQSPTNMNFPNNASQTPPVVPVATSGFPEYGGNGPAFATGGVHINTNQDSYRNAYSSTGFNMMTVLTRVAHRKDPIVNLGNVDLSCAFVVCDVMQHDIPIVYCSENFERLTGYNKHEILGRNCRFLQAPSGCVQAGLKRKYVDDDGVLQLKNIINARGEIQISLINYRKGGQPFMNLLTVIPINYDTDEIKYYVGFQVDLVEQPHSVTKKNPNGTYTINYQRGLQMPRYIFNQEQNKRATAADSGQTIPRDEVSTVLSTIGSGESDLSRRIWDKVLLENTDDVIFVLSLKGLFLYLSPSCRKLLEYDANELMGTALSSVCHPSDIVPVTRELKDTTTGVTVSVVFRIRRKENGYMWFEGHGSLYIEQGKGRKSIVLVGRERPVYTLKKPDILSNGGVGENEVWTKLSTSGMFLYVSSSIRGLLDKQPSELVGTSIQSLMRSESRPEFGRILEIARSGKRAQTRHELVNRRGQVLQAFSTVHPGDATEGSKPTFFIAQTRLLKYSRPTSMNSNQKPQNQQTTSGQKQQGSANPPRQGGHSRPGSSAGPYTSPNQYMSTFETAATYAGGDSLPLGRQDAALADELNLFDELKTTRSTSWQYELRQMEKRNRLLAEELQSLLAAKKKRKRRKPGVLEKECANCHTKQTPEWRRGPSGNRDLCNSCGLRWAKQQGRISPRTTSQRSGHSAASDPQSERHAQNVAQQQPTSGSGAMVGGEKEGSSGPSGGGKSIDETLAPSNPQHRSLSAQGSRPHSQQQTPTGGSGISAPPSKASRIDTRSRNPTNGFRNSVQTKIEEED